MSDTTRIVYGKSSGSGTTGTSARSAIMAQGRTRHCCQWCETTMASTEVGANIASPASRAPSSPCARSPTKTAISMFGPGVSCASV